MSGRVPCRLSDMDYPTPEDPKRAPVWENYVIAQAAQASLGMIPAQAHALGVEVEGRQVALVLQAPAASPAVEEDMADMVSELGALMGPEVAVSHRLDVRAARRLSPHDGVAWFFASRD
jgi:hypothetical protein